MPTAPRQQKTKMKPALRGVSHQLAAVGAASAGAVLVAGAPDATSRLAATIYTVSLTIMLSISAFYHIPTWSPEKRALLRRFDHSGIYLIIAAT
jgi:hemolysin III